MAIDSYGNELELLFVKIQEMSIAVIIRILISFTMNLFQALKTTIEIRSNLLTIMIKNLAFISINFKK